MITNALSNTPLTKCCS